MVRSLRRLAFLFVMGASLCAPNARAEADPQTAARDLFQRGVKAVAAGDLMAALTHFQTAYEKSPNQTVLFNIAQTQIALGRPVEGAKTLRRYVELDSPPAGNARGRRVRELLAYTERQLGKIALEVTPADALVEVDGQAEKPDSTGTIEAPVGSRQLVVTRAGYQPLIERVDVTQGKTTRVRLALMRAPVPPPLSPKVPPAPLKGELVVRTSHRDALVLVDGSPLVNPKVDPGTYVIEVTRKGYQPWRRNAEVRAGQTAVVTAWLAPAGPSPEERARANRRSWAVAGGVVGLAFAGTGIGLLVSNHERYRDYRRDHDAFSSELASGVSAPDHPARAASLEARAARIQRTDDIGTGMTILGGLMLAVTGTLFAWDLDVSGAN